MNEPVAVKMEVDAQPPPPPPPEVAPSAAGSTSAAAPAAGDPAPNGAGAAQPTIVNTPQEMDEEEKENIEELLHSLEDFVPAIPDEVVNYYLTKTGFMCSDEKMCVLKSVFGKFVADIAEDALQYCKIRQQSPANRDKHRGKGQRLVLTMDDLSQSLKEYGITVKKPEYFVDRSTSGATGSALSASTSSATTSASGPDKKKKRTK